MNESHPDCVPWSPDRPCKTIFYVIVSVQLVITTVGIILNLTIVIVFCRRASLRKKIPYVLLFNQAVADLFNAACFGISMETILLSNLINGNRPSALIGVMGISLIMTTLSSLLLFTLIAFERLLSIYLPLWHRVHVLKKHIWIAVVMIW